ncbi:MAG TPA: DUF4105 domain-containing protein [Chryseolinea sp.]|nr:DUF4105 domain-containing protein [Chryseolinea sp.]
MNKIICFVLLLFTVTGSWAQKLSDNATISVITCGPHHQVSYICFGHSAFRVRDPRMGIDYAFNYGIFDFDGPDFFVNFAIGHNVYLLGVQEFEHFKNSYIEDNRYVHEQILNLTLDQKQKIFDYLAWNAAPENREYLYDYFYDNCATRIRDVVVKTLGDDVSFDGSYIATDYTIRQLTDIYLKPFPWLDLGIDVCLGLPMDKKASPYEYMFLPDYIESGFDHATVKSDSGAVPIVMEKDIIYAEHPEEQEFSITHPLYVFSFLLVVSLVITLKDFYKKKLSNWFDVILFGSTGMIGVLLLLLWFLTDHRAAANNFNLLWALPTHLIAVIAFVRAKRWLINYFLAVLVLQGLVLLFWWALPQQLNLSLIPVVVILLLRALAQYSLRKQVASR